MKHAVAVAPVLALAVLALAVLASACTPAAQESKPTPEQAPPPAAKPAPIEQAAPGTTFGQRLSNDTPFVELSKLLEDPKAWEGKRVRTRGEVVAVCQAAGCWADLKPEGSAGKTAPPTHVTMHGHAFFLPKTAKTKLAELEGNLTVRALSQAEVDHFNGEGASLTAGATILNVDALGVVLR